MDYKQMFEYLEFDIDIDGYESQLFLKYNKASEKKNK